MLYMEMLYNAVYENVRKHKDIKLVTTNDRRKRLVSQPNYHTSKHFSEDLMAIEMRKTSVLMNKPIYIGQTVLDFSKILMYDFWYGYLKPMYKNNIKLCYMDTDSFTFHVKTDDFYKDISDTLDKWFDTSKNDKKLDRPIEYDVNTGVLGMFKDELKGSIMIEFVSLASKVYSHKQDNDKETKVVKGVKKCVKKKILNFNDYINALLLNKKIMIKQQSFKSFYHDMYTIETNKIALRNSDNKRLTTFDGITTYPYGTNAFKVCEEELFVKLKQKSIPLYT